MNPVLFFIIIVVYRKEVPRKYPVNTCGMRDGLSWDMLAMGQRIPASVNTYKNLSVHLKLLAN